MIRAILFDMDDTLLDINLMAFMMTYGADLSSLLAKIAGGNPARFAVPLLRGYLAMDSQDRADGMTNADIFAQEFERVSSVPIADPAIIDVLAYYEREILPHRARTFIAPRPMPGGLEALKQVEKLGLRFALATNPSFSQSCIECRMGWAHIDDVPFERVSHMGNSTRVKPRARYYEEFIALLGLIPQECLMVGNDAKRDFSRPDIGLRTIYVGHARPKHAIWSGHMSELADALPALIDHCNLEDEAHSDADM